MPHQTRCLIDHVADTTHKTFEACFEKLCARLRAAEEQRKEIPPSWLGALDIDRFKLISDQHGRPFGDEVLLLVSQVLRATLRGTDPLFRCDGAEFLVIFERTARTGADIAFERLRSAIAAHLFPQIGHVTVSVGYTQILPSDVPTLCIERADTALCDAKHGGRTATHHYGRLVQVEPLFQQR